MNEAQLLELFRQVLRATVAVPLLASGAGCGNSGGGSPPEAGTSDRDTHTGDSGKSDHSTHDGGQPQDAGIDAAHDTGNVVDGGRDVEKRPDATPDGCAFGIAECVSLRPFYCAEPVVAADASGELPASQCAAICPPAFQDPACFVGSQPDGGGLKARFDGGRLVVQCSNTAGTCNGRAFAGMEPPRAPGQRSAVGRYFAESAQLEAASVDAFHILSSELNAHHAPRELVAAAEAAARDEVRHARMTRSIARRYGRCPVRRRAAGRPVRSLEAIAAENAVEGCVRETYGALVAHHQAAMAANEEIRRVMGVIARDETRHAALGWAVAAWAESQLDDAGRARVVASRRQAVRELRASAASDVPSALVLEAGVPGSGKASVMLEALDERLWSSKSIGL